MIPLSSGRAGSSRNLPPNRAITAWTVDRREVLTESDFEVVVFGKNVALLSAFGDELPLIQKALDHGIRVIACGRSLRAF